MHELIENHLLESEAIAMDLLGYFDARKSKPGETVLDLAIERGKENIILQTLRAQLESDGRLTTTIFAPREYRHNSLRGKKAR